MASCTSTSSLLICSISMSLSVINRNRKASTRSLASWDRSGNVFLFCSSNVLEDKSSADVVGRASTIVESFEKSAALDIVALCACVRVDRVAMTSGSHRRCVFIGNSVPAKSKVDQNGKTDVTSSGIIMMCALVCVVDWGE